MAKVKNGFAPGDRDVKSPQTSVGGYVQELHFVYTSAEAFKALTDETLGLLLMAVVRETVVRQAGPAARVSIVEGSQKDFKARDLGYTADETVLRMDCTGVGPFDIEVVNARHTVVLVPPSRLAGTWVDPIPELRYRVTCAGDVAYLCTMDSSRSKVDGVFADKVRGWPAVEPCGRELWIDDDRAVGSFVGGTPWLVGYLGPDPVGDSAHEFFTPHFYITDGDAVVDLDTGEHRTGSALTTLDDGSSLQAASYGDVLLVVYAHSGERVATVMPAGWCPHLDGAEET